MPKGYVIFTEAIKDPDAMVEYGRAAATVPPSGGMRPLAVDSAPGVLEGEWHGNQTVILEFESVEAARTWYESPEYQRAAKLRQAAAETNVVIVAGFEAPKREASQA
ncbi:DUF1330 domain-containing protein [Nocardia jejuensis]|uniref:DUF1330 domain-containing protein n=1 Tax=Nocardia jejuensis TaxID=328049 RepID=UPI0008309862|nr:DUF1330 domain-containing protein [Nocardia jejuensis]